MAILRNPKPKRFQIHETAIKHMFRNINLHVKSQDALNLWPFGIKAISLAPP